MSKALEGHLGPTLLPSQPPPECHGLIADEMMPWAVIAHTALSLTRTGAAQYQH